MTQSQKLTHAEVKAAKPKTKSYKLADGGGLVLLVNSNGSKYWRYRYRFNGAAKMLSLGTYPDTSLSLARKKHQDMRTLLAEGIDPSAKRKAEKEAIEDSFKAVMQEFMAKSDSQESTLTTTQQRFDTHVLPYIGKRPISEIDSQELHKVLKRVEARGTYETARRIRSSCSQVFRYAIVTGRATIDPAAPLVDALKKPEVKHMATILDPDKIGALMRGIENFQGTPTVHAALKLSPLLFQRPGEIRAMEWCEINWEEERWELPDHKMKMGVQHIVPLCRQALEILRELHPLTGDGRYVLPSARGRSRPLSENGVRTALRTMGYSNDDLTPHGFRAMARTLLDEVLGYRVDYIEHQLAHAVRDANGRAYNRTSHLPARRKMMQTWGDYLDTLREGGKIASQHGDECLNS
jgi:integrase